MATFKARFYDVVACGYFARGGDAPEFGDLPSMLDDLRQWSIGKSLIDTRVPGTGASLPTYLFDIRRHGDICVLTLWNEVPSDEGNVASVIGTALVGGASVLSNPIAPNSIPGFPTYFLFSLSRSLLAPLKIGDNVLGLAALKHYLGSFLQQSSSRTVVEDNGVDSAEIVGYLDDSDDVRADVIPRFKLQLVRLTTQANEILSRAGEIRKVVRVREVDTGRPIERALFQRVLESLGFAATPRSETVRIRQEVAVSMSREQVSALISSLEGELEPRVNDVAFVFERDPSEHWLSSAIPSSEVDLPVEKVDGVYSADQLAAALSRRASRIFGVLDG